MVRLGSGRRGTPGERSLTGPDAVLRSALEAALRSALDTAWSVAKSGYRETPQRPAPRALQPLLGHARLTSTALATIRRVLDGDDAFRQRVAETVTEADVGRAGWLFLTRPEGWEAEVAALAAADAERADAERAGREERSALRRLRGAEEALAETRARLADANAQLARARRARQAAEAEVQALRSRATALEATPPSPPPPPAPRAPVTVVTPTAPPPRPARRKEPRARRRPTPLPPGVRDDLPEAAEHLVRIRGVLVLVDGYNASLAYRPDLPIPELRRRLVDALDELAARTGADVLVVFDGAEVAGDGPTSRAGGRRRVARVRFSPPDVEADDVILGMVDEVPLPRAVVVASDDRRVREGADGRGANVISTGQLLAALRRER